MKTKRLAPSVVVSLALSLAGVAHAGGFYVPEIGARATSMGAAMTAQSEDASAIFHNPAAMQGQKGTQVQVAGLLFFPSITFFRRPGIDPNTNESLSYDPVENSNSLGAAPYFAVMSDLGSDRMSAGFALTVPFGAALSYPADGSQRHVVTHVALEAIHVGPALAYKLSNRFRLGLAVNYIFSELTIEQGNAMPFVTGDPEQYPDPDPALEGHTVLEGRDLAALGATLGLLYSDPQDRFDLGLSVIAPVTLNFEGTAAIHNDSITAITDDAGDLIQGAGTRTDDIHTQMPLPLIVRVGTAFRPIRKLMLAFDVSYQRWSANDELVVDFDNNHLLIDATNIRVEDVTVPNQWKDTFSVRFGGEYTPSEASPLRLRAGALFDQSPVKDEYYDLLTPDSDKVGVGAGVAYAFDLSGGRKLDLELAYSHLFVAEREVSPEATGSKKTILNNPAPSFYYGVTRARFDLLSLSVGLRM